MAASRPIRCRSTSPPKRKPCLGNGHPRPFRSTNPGPLPESSMDADPQDSILPSMSHMSGHVSPIRARTIKEYDQEITDLRKENFNLKLRLYFLEENIDKKFDGDSRELHKINIHLKVEVKSLQDELDHKNRLLQEALGTLEKIEEKHRCELVELSTKAEQQIMMLKDKISSLHHELQKYQSRESETDGDSKMYKQAFGLEDLSLQSFSDTKSQNKNLETELEELHNHLTHKEQELKMKEEELKETRRKLKEKEENCKLQEERVTKRSKAIQGLVTLLHNRDKEIGKLQMEKDQKSKGSGSDSFDSQTLDVLKEVNSENSSSEPTISSERKSGNSPNHLNEIKLLKKELKRKQKTIKALEEALIKKESDQQIQMNGLQETKEISAEETEKYSSKMAALEQECYSLQQSNREKDIFIQELLDHRNNGYMTDWSEELKTLKEQLSEKDNDLSLRIQTINTLKNELLQNQSQYEAATSEAEHNYQQFLEVTEEKEHLSQQLKICKNRLQQLLEIKEIMEQRLQQSVSAFEDVLLQLSREKSDSNIPQEFEEKDRKLDSILRELKAIQDISSSNEKLCVSPQKPEQLSFENSFTGSEQDEQCLLNEQLKTFISLSEEDQSSMQHEDLHRINKGKDVILENQDLDETLNTKLNDMENTHQKQLNSSNSNFNKINELEKVYYELDKAREELNELRNQVPDNLEIALKDSLIKSLQEKLNKTEKELEQYKHAGKQHVDKMAHLKKAAVVRDNLKIGLELKVKSKDTEMDDQQLLLIQQMELEKEQYEKKEVERELNNKQTKIAQLLEKITYFAVQVHEHGLKIDTLQEENSRLLQEIHDKNQELDMLRVGRGELEERSIILQGKLHQAVMRVNELEKTIQDSRMKPKVPTPRASVLIQTEVGQHSPKYSTSLDILSLLTSSQVQGRRSRSMENLPNAPGPVASVTVSDNARHSLPVSFRPKEQQSSPSSSLRCLMTQSLTHFGHSDSIYRLKEEICALVLRLEQAEKQSQIRQHQKTELEQSMKVVEHDQSHPPDSSKLSNPRIVEILYRHLEEEVEFLEQLLLYEQTGKLNCSALSPEELAQFRKRLIESRELSQSLSTSLLGSDISSMLEETISASVCRPSVDPNASKDATFFLSKTKLQVTQDSQRWAADRSLKEDNTDQTEGRETWMVPTGENRKQSDGWDQTSQRHHWSIALQHQPISEWISKEQSHFNHTEQLVVLEASDSDDILLLLNDQGLPENVYLRSSWQQRSDGVGKICQIQEIKEKATSKDDSSVNDSSKNSKYLNHQPSSVLKEPNDTHLISEKSPIASASDKANYSHSIQNLSHKSGLSPATRSSPKPYHVAQPSSDSDIWSEPDRNISLQRIGMDLKAMKPKFQRRGNSSSKLSDNDYTSEYSSHLPSSSKGKGRPGASSGYHGSKHKIRGERLESRLSNIEERSEALDAKLTRYFDMSDQIRCLLSELLVTKQDQSSVKMLSELQQSLEQVCCHQKTVADAVREWGALKGKTIAENETQTSLLLIELEDSKEVISDTFESGEDLKATLKKENMARRQAEKQVADYCHEIEICNQTIKNLNMKLQESDMGWKVFREKVSNIFGGRFGSDPSLDNRVHDRYSNLFHEICTLEDHFVAEQDRVRKLEQEKAELERNFYYESNENKHIQERVKKLQDENLQLKHERAQFQDKFITTDKMCLHLKEDLQVTKEKLENMLEKCGKLESELFEETNSKTELSNKNKSLEEKLSLKQQLLQKIDEEKCEIQIALKEKDDYSRKLKTENDLLKDQMVNLKQQIEKINGSLNKTKEDKDSLQEQLSSLKQQAIEKELLLKNVKTERDDLQSQLFPLQKKLEEQKLSWKSLGEEKNAFENQVAALEKQIKKNDVHHKQLEEKLVRFQDEISELQVKVKEKETLLKRHEEERDSLHEQVSELQRDMRKKESSHKQTKQKLQELEDQNYELKMKMEEMNIFKKKVEEENVILHEQVSNLQQLLKKAEFTQKKLEDATHTLQNEISDLNHDIEEKDCSLKSLEKERDHLQCQLEDLKHEFKKKESLLKIIEKERNYLQDHMAELEWKVKEKDLFMKKVEEENNKCKNNITKQEEEIKENKSLLKQVTENRDVLRQQVFNLEQQYKEQVCDFDPHKINAKHYSNEQVIALQNSVQELQRQLKRKECYAENAEEEKKSLETCSTLMKHEYSSSAIVHTQTENDTARLNFLESKISNLEKELKEKEIALKEVQEECDKLYSQVMKGNNLLESYEKKNRERHLKISILEKQLKDQDSTFIEITDEDGSLQSINKYQNVPSATCFQQTENLIGDEKKSFQDKIATEKLSFVVSDERECDQFSQQSDFEERKSTLTENEQTIAFLKRKVASLSSHLNLMESEKKILEQSLLILQQKLESKPITLTQNEEKIVIQSMALLPEQLKVEEQKQQFEEKIEELTEQLKMSEVCKMTLEEQLSDLKQQLNEKDEVLNKNKKEKIELQNNITELTLKLQQQLKSSPEKSLSINDQDNDTLYNDKMIELKKELNKIHNDKDDLSKQFLELKQYTITLENQISQLQMQLKEKEGTSKQISEKLAGNILPSFERQVEESRAAQIKISELEDLLNKNEFHLNQTAQENIDMKSKYFNLHNQFEKQIEMFNSEREEYQNEIHELKNRMHSISEEKNMFQNQLTHLKSLLRGKETESLKTENNLLHSRMINNVRRISLGDLQQIQQEIGTRHSELVLPERELATWKHFNEDINYFDDDDKTVSKTLSAEFSQNLKELKQLQQNIEEEKQLFQSSMSELIKHLNELSVDMNEKKQLMEYLSQLQQQISKLEKYRDKQEIYLQNLIKERNDLQSLANDLKSKLQKSEKNLQTTLENKNLLLEEVSKLQDALKKGHVSPKKYQRPSVSAFLEFPEKLSTADSKPKTEFSSISPQADKLDLTNDLVLAQRPLAEKDECLDRLQKEKVMMKEREHALKQQLKERDDKCNSFEKENASLRKQLYAMELEMKQLKTSGNEDSLKEELKVANKRIEKYETLIRSLQIELKTYEQLNKNGSSEEPTPEESEAFNKSLLMEVLGEMRQLRGELEKAYQVNNYLRRAFVHKMLGAKNSSKEIKTESSSEQESQSKRTSKTYSEGTLTFSRAGSLSQSSLDSSSASCASASRSGSAKSSRGHHSNHERKSKKEKPKVLPTRASSDLLLETSAQDISSANKDLSRLWPSESLITNQSLSQNISQNMWQGQTDVDIQPSRERDLYFVNSLKSSNGNESEKLKHDKNHNSVIQRSHYSSPDLGIESDPNHDISAVEAPFIEESADNRWPENGASQYSAATLTVPATLRSIHGNSTQKSPQEISNISNVDERLKDKTGQWTVLTTPGGEINSLHAIARLEDYELLKKEIQESEVGVKGIIARVKDRLLAMAGNAVFNKSLENSTLKAISSSCHNVEVCLGEAVRLITCFWVTSFPSEEHVEDWNTLLRQNIELREELSKVRSHLTFQTKELQQAMDKLTSAERRKKSMEKAITKQLTKTEKVLKLSKSNLQHQEQKRPASHKPA